MATPNTPVNDLFNQYGLWKSVPSSSSSGLCAAIGVLDLPHVNKKSRSFQNAKTEVFGYVISLATELGEGLTQHGTIPAKFKNVHPLQAYLGLTKILGAPYTK